MSNRKAHEHFCSSCYGPSGIKGVRNRGGWWKCFDKKCVKLPSFLCAKHDTALSAKPGGPK